MAHTTRLLVEVRNVAPGALDGTIKDALWSTINEACRLGWIWRDTIDVTLINGVTDYSLAPPTSPSNADIVHVADVAHPTLYVTGPTYDPETSTLTIPTAPTAAHTGTPMEVALVLAPLHLGVPTLD